MSQISTSYREPHFTLQWHITARCDNRCSHCYIYNSDSLASEIDNELKLEECLRVIDDFVETFQHWKMPCRINFTGGDPLLRPDLFELIKYACNKDIVIGIMGNSNHLDMEKACHLKDLGVYRYQVSIDGIEETHDSIRGKGNFRDTIRALQILNEARIPSIVMFTLSKQNADNLIDIINLVAENDVSIFDFARLVPIGNAMKLKDQILSAQEYRNLLLRVLEKYKNLQDNGCRTYFGRKDHLWNLLYKELGLWKSLPQQDKKTIYSGCGIGSSILTILADGTVYPCRRLPVKIGKVPEQSIRDIFIESSKLNKMRQVENMEKCSKCELMQFCRGCMAVAYAVHSDYMAPDPQCWKKI